MESVNVPALACYALLLLAACPLVALVRGPAERCVCEWLRTRREA